MFAPQTINVFPVEWKIRAAKSGHIFNGILAAGAFHQHAVSGDHRARAIDSVYAVDIYRFARIAHDCQELSDVTVKKRPIHSVQRFKVCQVKIIHRLGGRGGDRDFIEGTVIVAHYLKVHYRPNMMIYQPRRIRLVRSFAAPKYLRGDDAEIPNRGIETVGAGPVGGVLGEIDACSQQQQADAGESTARQQLGSVRPLELKYWY